MHYLSLTLPTLAENLALDEALLLRAETEGGEVLRLWEWPTPAVVLGAGCRLAQDVNEAACQRDSVPILRRSSGGGTVLLGAGCLVYSLVLDYDRAEALREVRPSYAYILGQMAVALSDVVAGVEHVGISDLAIAGRKFSGNAQQRKRTRLLHHGTLLYGFDLALVDRYLAIPERQPQYRANRGNESFLVNLSLGAAELRHVLLQAWQAETELTRWPKGEVTRLSSEKYTRPEWTRRR